MTIDEARDALSTLAVSLWVAHAPTAAVLLFDNTKTQHPPTDSSLWGRLHIQHDRRDRVSLGDTGALFRQHGQLFVQVFAPPGSSTALIEQVVNDLVIGFENAGRVGEVWFQSVTAKDVGPDGTFYQMNCELKFTYDRSN